MLSAVPLHRYRTVLALGLAYLVLSVLLRLVLWAQFGSQDGVGVTELPWIIAGGMVNDTLELLYLLLPFSLYLLLIPRRWYTTRWHRWIVGAGCYAALFGMLYLAAAEYFFFEEFDARFNLVAVDYLIYPHEVLINIWESYPVAQFIVADAMLSALILWRLWPRIKPDSSGHDLDFRRRGAVFGLHGLAVALTASTFSTNTLAFSGNRVSNELEANGISSFFRAAHTNELDYKQLYRTGTDARMLALLPAELTKDGSRFTHLAQGSLERHHPAKAQGLGKLNVVVIVEESLGARFVGAYGSNQQLTPYFDALAKQGLLFENVYASGTRTVRGLEAITTSFPPIPSESILKRPHNENIANWGQIMRRQGYHTSFLYGGYGQFDNMNYFYSQNGFAISDRTEIANVRFANIWGVSDEDLFRHALGYFDQRAEEDKPFFSIVMTTSNHKPYTFPAGIPNVPAEGGGRDAGVRYADYALGHFIAEAKTHDWYNNTLFVIVADHDARVYGRDQIPVDSYRIPLLLFAPSHLSPGHITTVTSQIDIAPTVLGLLGFAYDAPFFGEDVLALNGQPHPIFMSHNHDVAVFYNGKIAVLGLQKSAQTYRYDAGANKLIPTPHDTALLDLTTAYYQTAFEQFRHHTYQ